MRKITDAAGLAEITSVSVDKGLPQSERCAEYKRQIKDMENYKCTTGGQTFTVRAVYAKDGTSIEDCFRGMMA